MRPLHLNLLTLYADLAQSLPREGPAAAALSRRVEGGKARLYATVKDGAARRQRYVGTAGDPKAEAAAGAHRRAADAARVRRKTVSTLKRAGVPAPSLALGRLLEVLANAGFFRKGGVLVGTSAFQLYAPIVGASLASSALMTADAELAIARLAAPMLTLNESLGDILKRADPTFAPAFKAEDRLPKEFRSDSGFAVEVVTTKGRNHEPLPVKGLMCAATPLKFLDYLLEESVEAVALYGSGVATQIPDPARYAVHKLIVAQERPKHSPKTQKDILQAREIRDALGARDAALFDEAVESAASRGRTWKVKVERGLALLDP